jgi:putative transcriptional regulator
MGKDYNRLKEILEAKGKTQTWLAEKLDVDFVTVNRYANNHTQPPIEVLDKIAKLLGVKLKELLND